MATNKFQELKTLSNGTYQGCLKVRVIRFWRGVSKTGEVFKGFNVILLDSKNNPIHAFIPALYAYEHERKLQLGNVCIIANFTVQPYKPTDKFRSLRNDKQLLLGKQTTIQQIEDTGSNIARDWFDLYDHSDLKPLSQQTIYLADVVGVIKDHLPFHSLKNKHGKIQSQARFTISDGSCNVKVTFWDQFGESFEKAMLETLETPVIIIIASSRVGWWNEEVNLANVAATQFFLNYKHHSVMHLRKMLTYPDFNKQIMASKNNKEAVLLTLEQLLQLGNDSINTEVMIHVKITHVEENQWYYITCTSCNNETEKEDDHFTCIKCNRTVPYPDMKFKLTVLASDGNIQSQIILEDRQVRALTGKRAMQLLPQEEKTNFFPPQLKALAQKEYTIKLDVRDANVVDKMQVFWATNICHGFKVLQPELIDMAHSMQQTTSQPSTSTIHLEDLSDNQSTQMPNKETQMGNC